MAPLRLKRLHVRGFKSLVSFGLTFPTAMKVLIGANGSGKSSILQALDFIKYFATGFPEFFFENRKVAPGDFVSIQSGSPEVAFDVLFERSEGGVCAGRSDGTAPPASTCSSGSATFARAGRMSCSRAATAESLSEKNASTSN